MTSKWTIEDVRRLEEKGVKIEKSIKPKLLSKTVRPSKKEPEALRHIKEVLWLLKIDYQTEYQFHPARKFRFDIAIPELKLGIEFEGLISDKSRHTTITGYTNDCIKYNLAQSFGWKVYRYTVLNYKDFYNDIKNINNL